MPILKKILVKLGLVCEKTGRFRPAARLRGAAVVLFPLVGLLSLAWFVVRVVPKPSRAAYPCMRTAAPLASGFVTWLAGLPFIPFLSEKFRSRRFGMAAAGVAVVIVAAILGCGTLFPRAVPPPKGQTITFKNAVVESPGKPMGTPVGIFPGRVVWAWNSAATNENLTNEWNDGWFLPKNNDRNAIDAMLSDGLRNLTGSDTDGAAWDAVFRFYNRKRGLDRGYSKGEKIFVKINAVSAWDGNFNPADNSIVDNEYYGNTETSPELVLAVLRALVRTVGVAQPDIHVGDPISRIYKHSYDLLSSEFPDVHYVEEPSSNTAGREKAEFTKRPAIFYSDRGTVMTTDGRSDPSKGEPTVSDSLCTLFETSDYLINIPAMKGHRIAGVSLFAKNHFGSHGRDSAYHLHGGLVNPTQLDNPYRQGYGLYRVQVDLMGHRLLGGKTLLYLLDALYAGSEATDPPTKWKLPPFENDWTSSLFVSLDPVAIESVAYDFLRSEYTEDTPFSWVQMRGVDDYLHQAADRTSRPENIVYDPEGDGVPVGSLGVHEHWNNPVEKKYSRNLGAGTGIELVRVDGGQ